MNSLLARSLIVGAVCSCTPLLSYANEAVCDFSSAKDFFSETSVVFPVHGMRLNFQDNSGFTSQRPFLISRCEQESGLNCFRAAYFSFGVPNKPISQGDSWIIDGEQYVYEQDIDLKLLGRSEKFAVITSSLGDKVKNKFLVNEVRGLAAIIFFNDEGRADYQVYLQENSCRPFPVLIKVGSS